MDGFLRMLRGMGPARLGLMGAAMVGMLAFFLFLTTRMNTGQMAVLYTDLPPGEAGQIVTKLESMQIPVSVSPDGGQIRVPSEQVGKLRMTLASEGLPSGGKIGNELFDKQSMLGVTDFQQRITQLRALEGELSRSIETLSPVKAARVHVVLPARELFAREAQTATASVILTLKPGQTLGKEQVGAVQHLVASAVPQLKPSSIAIIDQNGDLLAKARDASNTTGAANDEADERKQSTEMQLQQKIEDQLGRIVGYGKVKANVTAELDFNRISKTSEEYDPEKQVVLSTQTSEEKSNESTGSNSSSTASVANNLPGAQKAAGGDTNNSNNNKTEETTNYSNTKTVTNTVQEVGQIKRLAVAVVVDGTYVKKPKAAEADAKPDAKADAKKDAVPVMEDVYQPRSAEELGKLQDIVKAAMAFDEKRGDQVKVENMQFAKPEAIPEEAPLPLGMTRSELMGLVETGIIGLVAVLFILLVVRPLVTKVMADTPAGMGSGLGLAVAGSGNGLLTDQSSGMALLSGGGNNSSDFMLEGSNSTDQEIERMINLEQVEGRVRASSLKKVSEIIDKNPEQAVAILRNWMYQDAG